MPGTTGRAIRRMFGRVSQIGTTAVTGHTVLTVEVTEGLAAVIGRSMRVTITDEAAKLLLPRLQDQLDGRLTPSSNSTQALHDRGWHYQCAAGAPCNSAEAKAEQDRHLDRVAAERRAARGVTP